MTISARVLADSLAPCGARLTTVVATYPRIILAECNTHRLWSRNSASSRAIPAKKMREMVKAHPFRPIWWGKNQAGMQAPEELSSMRDCPEGSSPRGRAEELWDGALSEMLKYHEQLEEAGLHKQITNRILEPWMWVTSIISATDWENFFFLRVHPDAQNEFQTLARAIRDAMEESTPRVLPAGGWHLPLFTDEDWEDTKALAVAKDHPPFSPLEIAKRVSVGRCARVSYLTHEGKRDLR
ncbi:MAG: FAD-dependent thymidylate synthase, partial [Acidobacteria bacterium]|nr:FAD-dependent thymidylate synthase [Acidobacteriota bacterium]